ncbi:hypothetical protein GCM10023107_95480 [Actinoplanes octamycinicus]|nr:hypothetical protein Aoc01nite_21910 [Actinoplanes octamycinicus]
MTGCRQTTVNPSAATAASTATRRSATAEESPAEEGWPGSGPEEERNAGGSEERAERGPTKEQTAGASKEPPGSAPEQQQTAGASAERPGSGPEQEQTAGGSAERPERGPEVDWAGGRQSGLRRMNARDKFSGLIPTVPGLPSYVRQRRSPGRCHTAPRRPARSPGRR